jgi:hypothetical protein
MNKGERILTYTKIGGLVSIGKVMRGMLACHAATRKLEASYSLSVLTLLLCLLRKTAVHRRTQTSLCAIVARFRQRKDLLKSS